MNAPRRFVRVFFGAGIRRDVLDRGHLIGLGECGSEVWTGASAGLDSKRTSRVSSRPARVAPPTPMIKSPSIVQWAWPGTGSCAGKHNDRSWSLCGVHGNEVICVMLVERLRAELESGALAPAAGTLTLVFGDPRAVELGPMRERR